MAMLQELTAKEVDMVFGGASVDANRDFAGAEIGVGGGLVVAGDILGVAGLAVAGAGFMLGGGIALGAIAIYEAV